MVSLAEGAEVLRHCVEDRIRGVCLERIYPLLSLFRWLRGPDVSFNCCVEGLEML